MDELKETLQAIGLKTEIAPDYFHFDKAATVNEILAMDGEYGFILPKSHRIFLNHFNGGFISEFPVKSEIGYDSAEWNSNVVPGIQAIRAEYKNSAGGAGISFSKFLKDAA